MRLARVDLLLGGEQTHLADVLEEQLQAVGGHVRLEIERGLGLAPAALVGCAFDLRAGRRRRVDVLDELDLGFLEVAVQLLDVGLVQIEVGGRRGDLGEREHSDLLSLGQQVLDLFQLLQFHH